MRNSVKALAAADALVSDGPPGCEFFTTGRASQGAGSENSEVSRVPRHRDKRRGSILIIALFMIVVCLAAAAFAIDVAYMQLVQTQLRAATDAAARAGAQALTDGKSVKDARKKAKETAKANFVAGQELKLTDADIVFGTAAKNHENPGGRYLFSPGSTNVNAVEVLGKRTSGSESGPVPLFFGPKLFGTGPFEPSKSAIAMIADRDIVVVVDRSSSMVAEDGGKMPGALVATYGSDSTYDDDGDGKMRRIEALKVAVNEFRMVLQGLPTSEQIGLVSYDKVADTECVLDTDYTVFANKIYGMELGYGTNIGAGIDEAVVMLQNESLTRAAAVPVIILMTDGQHNGKRDPELAAQDAMLSLPRLTIHTLTFSDSAEISRMQSVAKIGKGFHVHAKDVSQLVSKFEEMAVSAGVSFVQ